MKYSDQQRIVKIYEYASKLNAYIKEHHVTQEEVLTDFSLQWLITTPLYNIGEQAYHLSAEYKATHSDIPWYMISGLRHRLVHDYERYELECHSSKWYLKKSPCCWNS